MKKSTFLATAIFAGAFAQPAFAQDAEPRFFDGFYVGGGGAPCTLGRAGGPRNASFGIESATHCAEHASGAMTLRRNCCTTRPRTTGA